jgi:hypothetical protein
MPTTTCASAPGARPLLVKLRIRPAMAQAKGTSAAASPDCPNRCSTTGADIGPGQELGSGKVCPSLTELTLHAAHTAGDGPLAPAGSGLKLLRHGVLDARRALDGSPDPPRARQVPKANWYAP